MQREHRSLRDAFGQFATGVAVVSARNENGDPIGITINSFASVSLEPPLVSWCIDKTSFRYKEFLQAEYYTISVLAASQRQLADLFASRSWDETVFDDVNWQPGPHQVPQYDDVLARFHCRQQQAYAGGDHKILLGKVESYDSEPNHPLVFSQGKFLQI